MGMHPGTVFLLCLVLNFFSIQAFSRESSSFCKILRSSRRGARREGHNEFRLRLEGDPETYQPGSTYRGEATEEITAIYSTLHLSLTCLSWSLSSARAARIEVSPKKTPKLFSALLVKKTP